MAALYDLKDEYLLAMQKMEDAGFDAETIKDTLDGLSGDLQDKIKNLAYAIKNEKAKAEAIKTEQARLAKRKEAAEKTVSSMTEYLLANMLETGVTVDDPVMPVKLAKCPASLGAIDEGKVPREFWITPEQPADRLDKAALLRAVKINPIEGVELIEDKKRVKIG